MINKKANLLNNVLTTVIAVIGLALIVYASWRLYSVYVGQDDANAQKNIDTIYARINLLEEGQFGKVVIRQIPAWFIEGWGKDDGLRPEACFFKSCICICKTAGADNAAACKTRGFCRFFDVANVSSYSFNLMKTDPFLDSPQANMLNFIRNPASPIYYSNPGDVVLSESSPPSLYGSRDYQDFISVYHKEISFGVASNLAELNIYRDKNAVAVLQLTIKASG